MRDGFVCRAVGALQDLVEHHKGRRAALTGLAVEVEPAVLFGQAAVEVDEIVDSLRLGPAHVRRGDAHVAEAALARDMAFGGKARDALGKCVGDMGFIVVAHRHGLHVRADGLCESLLLIPFDGFRCFSTIGRIGHPMPAHGVLIEVAV